MSSGGSSGKVEYPTEITGIFDTLSGYTGTGLVDLIMTEYATPATYNPYYNETAFDPSTRITTMETAINGLNTLIDGMDEETKFDALVDQIDTTLDDGGANEVFELYNPTTEIGTIVTNALSNLATLGTQLSPAAEADADSALGSAATEGANSAGAAVDAAAIQALADAAAGQTAASDAADADADGAIASAATAAAAVAAGAPLSAVSSALDTRATKTLKKSYNRLWGGAVDINAVMGTGFMVASANLEADHGEKITEFDANAALAAYNAAIGQYSNIYAASAGIYNQIYNEVYRQYVQHKGVMGQVWGGIFNQLSGDGTKAFIELFLQRVKYYSQLKLQQQGNRAQFIYTGIDAMFRQYLTRVQMEEAYARLATEGQRIAIVAEYEEAGEQLEIDVKEALYPYELFTYGANLLAAPSGAAMVPQKPSRGQTALSGALSGAAMGAVAGAEVGAIGGPMGMAIGAGIGALAGLF